MLVFCNSLSLRAVAVHAAVSGFAAGLSGHSAPHLYGQTRLCAPLDSAAQLLSSCFYRHRERENLSIKSGYQDVSAGVMDTFLRIESQKPHTWLRCDS